MGGAILIVEDRAHEPVGHYPVLFASLATTLSEMGAEVVTLTSRGWALDGDPAFPSFPQHRFGRLALVGSRLAEWITRHAKGRGALFVRDLLRAAAIIGAARRERRRIGATGVVIVSRNVHPVFAAIFADRNSWVVFRFDQPSGWMQSGIARPLLRIARLRNERRTRRSGGGVHLLLNNAVTFEPWRRLTPWLHPQKVPFTFSPRRAPVTDARNRLGIRTSARLGLMFGAAHGGKDLATVFEAFSELSGWQLVIAGAGSADAYEAWAAAHGHLTPAPFVFGGYVDVETRTSLFSAADAVILSFREVHHQDSGTLVDAISAGVAVAYSEGPEADLVRNFRIGEVFIPSDVGSLRAALHRIRRPEPADVAAAQEWTSPERGAGVILDLLTSQNAG